MRWDDEKSEKLWTILSGTAAEINCKSSDLHTFLWMKVDDDDRG